MIFALEWLRLPNDSGSHVMDHQVIRGVDQEETIGAHSGFRIRVVTVWDAPSRQFAVHAFVRGSETEEEVAMETQERRFALIQDAEDHGFALATQWIDRQAGGDHAQQ